MLYRLAESLPRNRFLGSLNVYKYGLAGLREGYPPLPEQGTVNEALVPKIQTMRQDYVKLGIRSLRMEGREDRMDRIVGAEDQVGSIGGMENRRN